MSRIDGRQGVRGNSELREVGQGLFALHQRHGLFPGDVMIELAIDALDLAGVSSSNPLLYSGIREKYLPEIEFRGNSSHQRATPRCAP